MYILSEYDFKMLEIILKDNFKVVNKSPYSLSLYNSLDIGWKYKPENSYRISNHWNFKGHCRTKQKVSNLDLSVGVYKEGYYNIINTFKYEKFKDNDFIYAGYVLENNKLKYKEFSLDIIDDNNIIEFKSKVNHLFCYKLKRRDEDIIVNYLRLEGNYLSLTNPSLDKFINNYKGSLYQILNKIYLNKEYSNIDKLNKIIKIAKINSTKSEFLKVKNGRFK